MLLYWLYWTANIGFLLSNYNAPASTRSLTISNYPNLTANIRGVQPFEVFTYIRDGKALIINLTYSVSPLSIHTNISVLQTDLLDDILL